VSVLEKSVFPIAFIRRKAAAACRVAPVAAYNKPLLSPHEAIFPRFFSAQFYCEYRAASRVDEAGLCSPGVEYNICFISTVYAYICIKVENHLGATDPQCITLLRRTYSLYDCCMYFEHNIIQIHGRFPIFF